jgi:hypothetical protein
VDWRVNLEAYKALVDFEQQPQQVYEAPPMAQNAF